MDFGLENPPFFILKKPTMQEKYCGTALILKLNFNNKLIHNGYKHF